MLLMWSCHQELFHVVVPSSCFSVVVPSGLFRSGRAKLFSRAIRSCSCVVVPSGVVPVVVPSGVVPRVVCHQELFLVWSPSGSCVVVPSGVVSGVVVPSGVVSCVVVPSGVVPGVVAIRSCSWWSCHQELFLCGRAGYCSWRVPSGPGLVVEPPGAGVVVEPSGAGLVEVLETEAQVL